MLADKFNIPYKKVVMFDDGNDNIKNIISNKFCGITVSNTPNICGISDQNLQDGINFMKNYQCIPPIKNHSISKGNSSNWNMCSSLNYKLSNSSY